MLYGNNSYELRNEQFAWRSNRGDKRSSLKNEPYVLGSNLSARPTEDNWDQAMSMASERIERIEIEDLGERLQRLKDDHTNPTVQQRLVKLKNWE